MQTRLLPRDEWSRLTGTELEAVWPVLPEGSHIIVVEDDDERIIGCWSIARYVHVEGVWVHPEHRKKGGVARRLLAMMRRTVRSMGADVALTGAMSDEVRTLLDGLHATKLPGDHYALPIRG